MSEKPKLLVEAEGVSAKPVGSIPKPAQVGDLNVAPTTTAADDLRTAAQRQINQVWEYTQAGVALLVTCATLWVSGKLALSDKPDTAAFLLLSNVFFMVMGMYFQRTNHQKESGVGKGDIGR